MVQSAEVSTHLRRLIVIVTSGLFMAALVAWRGIADLQQTAFLAGKALWWALITGFLVWLVLLRPCGRKTIAGLVAAQFVGLTVGAIVSGGYNGYQARLMGATLANDYRSAMEGRPITPTQVRGDGQMEAAGRIMSDYLKGVAKAQAAFASDMDRLGMYTPIEPAQMLTSAGSARNLNNLEAAEKLISSQLGVYDGLGQATLTSLRSEPGLMPAAREDMERSFESGQQKSRPVMQEYFNLTLGTVKNRKLLVENLIDTRGRWGVVDGQASFDNPDEMIEFNRVVAAAESDNLKLASLTKEMTAQSQQSLQRLPGVTP